MKLVYAQLLESVNPNRATLERLSVLHLSSFHKMTALYGEATLLHTISQFKLQPYDLTPSEIVVRSVRQMGESEACPKLEYLAAVCLSILPTLSARSSS